MSERTRYFKIEDKAIIKRIAEINRKNNKAAKIIQEFTESIGAKRFHKYNVTNDIAGFDFDYESENHPLKNQKNKLLFKQLRSGLYWPKKNSKEGKDLNKKIEELPKMLSIDSAITDKTGISTNYPVMFTGRYARSIQVIGFVNSEKPSKFFGFLAVPWIDYPSEEIEQYKKDNSKGIRFNSNLSFAINFSLPDGFREVKEWEYLRDIEQEKNNVKRRQ